MSRTFNFFLLSLLGAACASAQYADRYALILEDAPLASRVAARAELNLPGVAAARTRIEAAQSTLKSELTARSFNVTGSETTLLNAVFVAAPPERVAELKSLPGVRGVVRLRRFKPTLSTATQILNAPQAWAALGGMPNAGKGVKIAVIDSGVDQMHPSLQDSDLQAPAGFPKCSVTSDCTQFTNGKVIVARSYVRQLALGTGAIDPTTSRADDYSARDRSGHGTAVATCAAGNTSTDTVTIMGMAPKAWIGSYKVFGSPGINDFSSDDVLVAALKDALADGMDVVSMSIGGPAFTGPLDTGAACGQAAGVPCDIAASAFEAMANLGVPIVVAAGNEGADGVVNYPTFSTISSPGNAPSVITAGGTTNSHGFTPAVRLSGASVPANLKKIAAQPTEAGFAYGAYSAPLVDVATIASDGLACSALGQSTLSGKFALILRGTCTFATKMLNAVNAGAAGVVFYDTPNDAAYPFSPAGLSGFSQQAVFISNSDGVSLKAFLAQNPMYSVIIDPAGFEVALSASLQNQLVFYSSMGPALGTNGIKPDVLAVAGGGQNGDLIYMGSQSYDPLGDVYSATGYIAAAGTSFATPLTAGAAALVRQAHPAWSAAQVKSALVNTSTQDVIADDSGDPVSILQTGAGKVAADLALRTTITAEPSNLSFGALTNGVLPNAIAIKLTNTGTSTANLALAVANQGSTSTATLALDKTALTLAAGASATVNASVTGKAPAAGLYYGAVTVTGGQVPLRVPYLYLVGSTVPSNLVVLAGGGDGSAGQPLPEGGIAFQVTDANGIPVAGAPVNFGVVSGGVKLSNVSAVTDAYGIASADVVLGPTPGQWVVNGCLGACSSRNNFETQFGGTIRAVPTILAGGVANAASAAPGTPVAPGSFVGIYGTGLSDVTDITTTARLPMSIDLVNVSFDVPSAGLSIPGHLVFVSAGQINVQVPWELAGQSSAQVKVTIDQSYSNVVTVPLATYAPALFENPFGSGNVAAIEPSNAAAPIISASNPAKRGSVIALYANGLGPVDHTPVSGDAAPLTSLVRTTAAPSVKIGGVDAVVSFSGLTPGNAGLYQMNVTVPTTIAAGLQPVVVSIGGAAAKTLNLPVQ